MFLSDFFGGLSAGVHVTHPKWALQAPWFPGLSRPQGENTCVAGSHWIHLPAEPIEKAGIASGFFLGCHRVFLQNPTLSKMEDGCIPTNIWGAKLWDLGQKQTQQLEWPCLLAGQALHHDGNRWDGGGSQQAPVDWPLYMLQPLEQPPFGVLKATRDCKFHEFAQH